MPTPSIARANSLARERREKADHSDNVDESDSLEKSAKKPRRKNAQTLEEFFGSKGPLAQELPGYEMRHEQVNFAQAIEQAMREGKPCLAEAATGVGKSLGYLVPAVRAALDGKVTVISTHTISLQNQLIAKDIPLVLKMFPARKKRCRRH